MRRIIVGFLIAFLPMQMSWAMMASYGGHSSTAAETSKQHGFDVRHNTFNDVTSQTVQSQNPAHIGHHIHSEPVGILDITTGDSPANNPATSLDNDCGVCHVACCSVILLTQYPKIIHSTQADHVSLLAVLTPAELIAEIERPIWQPSL